MWRTMENTGSGCGRPWGEARGCGERGRTSNPAAGDTRGRVEKGRTPDPAAGDPGDIEEWGKIPDPGAGDPGERPGDTEERGERRIQLRETTGDTEKQGKARIQLREAPGRGQGTRRWGINAGSSCRRPQGMQKKGENIGSGHRRPQGMQKKGENPGSGHKRHQGTWRNGEKPGSSCGRPQGIQKKGETPDPAAGEPDCAFPSASPPREYLNNVSYRLTFPQKISLKGAAAPLPLPTPRSICSNGSDPDSCLFPRRRISARPPPAQPLCSPARAASILEINRWSPFINTEPLQSSNFRRQSGSGCELRRRRDRIYPDSLRGLPASPRSRLRRAGGAGPGGTPRSDLEITRKKPPGRSAEPENSAPRGSGFANPAR